MTIPMGTSVKLIGTGTRTDQTYQPVLSLEQLATLNFSPETEPFDGDASKFQLGIEAMHLALAYEYDPYFSLSIARIDLLPHQLEAVYDYFLKLPRIRFLLADDPDAGKTITAGLLLKELKIRGLIKRILIVIPARLTLGSGEQHQFVATGRNQYGQTMALGRIEWQVTGAGVIDQTGLFRAGPSGGQFTVIASQGQLSGQATVVVKERGGERPSLKSILITPQEAYLESGQDQTFTATGLDQAGQPVPLSNVIWQATGGEINYAGQFVVGSKEGFFEVTAFYMKVLTKFASNQELKLKLTVEVVVESTSDGQLSDQKIEETKIALRELGLDDRVEME